MTFILVTTVATRSPTFITADNRIDTSSIANSNQPSWFVTGMLE